MALRQLPLGRLNGPGAGRALDGAIPLGFGLILCLTVPLRTAFEFGADEGFELMKALLVSRGHPLYTEIWNDQPPLHTELLALLFRVFGPTAYVGRLLTVGFAMLLVGALYQLVKQQAGRIAGGLAVALLVSSASFPQLSVSVMLELPAMSLAMTSLWLLLRETDRESAWRWIGSGAVFACALQIKLTAVLFLPALLAGFFVSWRSEDHQKPRAGVGLSTRWESVWIWLGAVAVTWMMIALFTREWAAWATFWQSHFSSGTHRVAVAWGYRWSPMRLLEDWPLVISSGTGILFALFVDRRCLFIPVVLFATALGVHGWHRPYWSYYKLHFVIPMAWLGGLCVVSWFRLLWRQGIQISWMAKGRTALQFLLWSAVVAVILVSAPSNFLEELKRLQSVSIVSDNEIVRALRESVPNTKWVFTNHRTAAFWAGQMIPPQLAVIPKKRLWSNQITADEVVEILNRYAPEQILIPVDWEAEFQLERHLQNHYQKLPEPAAVASHYYRRQ